MLETLRTLDRAGHRSWVVGGTVRDLLLGRPSTGAADVATPATPQQVMALFPKVVPTGVEHGTVTVLAGAAKVEITTFRGEGRYLDGRRPSSVTFHTDLTEDLARRDFTMNALAWDPLAGELRDPFQGRADLRRRLIRAVGDAAARFAEDGLRPMRALRFVAQLGYSVERATLAAIPDAAPVMRLVSAERVADELSKLLAAPHAARALGLLRKTGLLGVVLPPIGPLPPEVAAHAVEVAASAVDRPLGTGASARRPELGVLRLAALLHVVPAADAAKAIGALRLPGRTAAEVSALLAQRPCLRAAPLALPEDPREVRRWLAAVTPARVPALLALWEADAAHAGRASRPAAAALRRLRGMAARALRQRPPLSTNDLVLDGRAVMDRLGLSPGPEVGEALRHLLDRVLDDPRLNRPGALEEALRAWWAARRGASGAGA
ncbi:MAG TPA: tRNA cytidylyltransferase [Anaeromyxobacteraceae bacterium]|nr:tRNA cytidylyltransferase [Anaeromyxobacteraceae bacterium]